AEPRPSRALTADVSRYLDPRPEVGCGRTQVRSGPRGRTRASAPSTVHPDDAAAVGGWRSIARLPGRRVDRPRRIPHRASPAIEPVAVQRLELISPPARPRPHQ